MDEKNIITVFHGTTLKSALKILKENHFNKSCNDEDWLGSGIYFYDNLNNAILYNIRKYLNKNSSYPNYNKLSQERGIIVANIEYTDNEIVDFNEIENLYKFLGLWNLFYNRVKNNQKYESLSLKDGYMINWLLNETDYFSGCKILKNIYNLDLRFNRNISEIFNNTTKIGYNLNQVFLCVLDESCIKNINLYDKNYKNEFTLIKNFTNTILMGMDKNEI